MIDTPQPIRLWYTRREVASMLHLSPRTIDNLIASGRLHVRRIGKSVRIPNASLEAFIRKDHPTQIAA